MAAAFECGSVLNVKFNKGSLEISHKHFHSIIEAIKTAIFPTFIRWCEVF